jgi:C4-dicarboxylate transporter DctM subunit
VHTSGSAEGQIYIPEVNRILMVACIALVVMEIGLITPPVGMNVYIINGVARDIPMGTIFRGVAPFLVSDILRVLVLVLFPSISLVALWVVG